MNLRKPVSHLSFNCCCTESPVRVVTQNKDSFNSCNANTLGRQISLESPNSGLTKFIYDKAGNMIHRITPNLRAENSVVTYKNAAEYEKDDDDDKPRSALFFYHPDHIGSTTFVSDAQGREYEHIEYTPYGETWLNTRRGNDDDHDDDEWDWDDDEGSPIRWRFTGKEIDPETGLQYFGARYQDPRTSRWISSDPAGGEIIDPQKNDSLLISAINWYSYSENNPVKYKDPDGKLPTVAVGAITGGIIGAVAGGISAVSQGKTSFRDIAAGAAGGAISGAVTGALAGTGVGVLAAGSFLGGAAGSVTENIISKGAENLTWISHHCCVNRLFQHFRSVNYYLS